MIKTPEDIYVYRTVGTGFTIHFVTNQMKTLYDNNENWECRGNLKEYTDRILKRLDECESTSANTL